MRTIKIPFKGIVRNTDEGVCEDGECLELINARIANGSIEPVSKPILVRTLSEAYKKIYYHQKADRYIAIKSDNTIVCISSDLSTATNLSTDLTNVTEISFVGLIVCVLTTSGIKYMRWQNNSYIYLGVIPDLPDIKIGKEIKNLYVVSDSTISKEDKNIFANVTYGYYLKLISKLNELGSFAHSTCIRIAYRLYDGSYVMHSPIRYIGLNSSDECSVNTYNSSTRESYTISLHGDGAEYSWSSAHPGDSTTEYIHFAGMGIKPTFTYDTIDLSTWKDIISSIDIFASRSIRSSFSNDEDKTSLIKTAVENESQFYKIASIDIKGNLSYPEQDVSSDTLSLNEQLSDDSYTHNKIVANNSYVYNSRLHIFNVSNDIYSGYKENYLFDGATLGSYTGDIYVYTYINTNKGDCIVEKHFTNKTFPLAIQPYIMYPDSRAYKIVIKFIATDYTRTKTFNLKKHGILNLAYNLNSSRWSSTTRPASMIETDSAYLDIIDLWDTNDINITPNAIIEDDNTKIKVSSLNNPFFFLARTTYQFTTEIMALQSNTTALSQGQFGQYPLYVFCKDGIYAMQVGTGETVYSSIVPISRDICESPNVCGIDNAVIFTTGRGVMAISGTQVECISEQLNGFLPSCTVSSPVISKILKIANMDTHLDTVTFNDYVKDAKIGYNYQDSEIIIANSDYGYSFVFNLKSKQWHKIDVKVSSFVISYPYTYVLFGTNLYNPYNPHRSISNIALVSRPLKIGTNAYKRLLQSALRGIVKRSLSDLYLRGEAVQYRGEDLTIFSDVGFYILGSEDGEHFNFLCGREKMVDVRDLVTKMNKTKACKYFMICLVGGVRSDVSINYTEMIIDDTYTNRLR